MLKMYISQNRNYGTTMTKFRIYHQNQRSVIAQYGGSLSRSKNEVKSRDYKTEIPVM